jgi:hypothetical protein
MKMNNPVSKQSAGANDNLKWGKVRLGWVVIWYGWVRIG